MLDVLIIAIALVALCIASVTDLRTHEVPDWLNYSLIALGLGIRLIWSLFTGDYSVILAGAIGFGVFFLVALGMFYTGQWGGGDSKMLMGLGALVGLEFTLSSAMISFLVNVVILGSLYGLAYSVYLSIRNRKQCIKELRKHSIRTMRNVLFVSVGVLVVIVFVVSDPHLLLLIISLVAVALSAYYMLIFIRVVEHACMLKHVFPSELTEGDWIARDVVVDKKRIAGPKDLGIDDKQIRQLEKLYKQGKVKKILIKMGIPFVPSFLLAFITTVVWGNLFLVVV